MHAAEDQHQDQPDPEQLEAEMHAICDRLMSLALGEPADPRVQAFAALAAAAKVAALVSQGQPRLADRLARGFVVVAQALSPAAVTVVDMPAARAKAH